MSGKVYQPNDYNVKNVCFTGIINEEEKASLYKMSEALIFPSLYEGFGLPVLEAQSLKIPVITSNSSSLPEISGEGALFIDPDDCNSIKEGLEKIIDSNFNKTELIRKGNENVKKFSWDKTALILLKIMETI